MADPVLREVQDGVGIITLNRPERLNAVNAEAGAMFERAMADFALDRQVKVIVITGAGNRGFCAGADAERLDDLAQASGATPTVPRPGTATLLDVIPNAPHLARNRYTSPIVVPKPVIAALNGASAGIGLVLAASCDIRFASRTAVFVAGFPRRGLPAEAAIAWTLQRLVGLGAASDILLSGRKVTAPEAQAMGLVNRVLEPEDLMPHTLAYARDIARNASPRATAVIKRQLRLASDQTYDEAMILSFDELLSSLDSEDFKEGVASMKDRRAPDFSGR